MHRVVFLLCLFLQYVYCQEEGEHCVNKKTSKEGTCQILSTCPSAIADLKNQIYPQICTFHDTMPVVCCEQKVPSNTTTTTTAAKPVAKNEVGYKSIQKCKEYERSVYELVQSPLLEGGTKMINVSTCSFATIRLIIRGTTAFPREFPHQALLGYEEFNQISWYCSGSLISENFVLTAAHCTTSREFGPVKLVRLGELDYQITDDDAKPQDFNVVEVLRHPDFKAPQVYNDIALLKLDRPVKFDKYIRPACLQTTRNVEADRFLISGWRFDGDSRMYRFSVNAVDDKKCNDSFKSSRKFRNGLDPETQLCAQNHERNCEIDTGGPLQIYSKDVYCAYEIVGVSSFGSRCFDHMPGVYTRVFHYLGWIEDTVWPDKQ